MYNTKIDTNLALHSRYETMRADTFAPWPAFDQGDLEAASRVLRSGKVNYWTGPEGRLFEEEYAAFCRCNHAIAVANGTLALELALHALHIGPGDEVIVPSRTFIASASCIVARGAKPVVADVDIDSQNLTVETIESATSQKTKAIICVHLAGWPCEMDEILQYAKKRGIAVVEDCSQAHGATYKGRPVGTIGDIGAFSFCQDKILTSAGEGGMLVTNRFDLWDRAWRYKDHGKSPATMSPSDSPSLDYRWVHESFGSNFRLSEVQSAIGRRHLNKLTGWVEDRRRNAHTLYETCQSLPLLRTPLPSAHLQHSYYKFYTFIRQERLAKGWDRNRVIEAIRSLGVPCFSGSCSEIYLEQAFPKTWRPSCRLPVAKHLGETSLMFLVHPTLSDRSIARTCLAIRDVAQQAYSLPYNPTVTRLSA